MRRAVTSIAAVGAIALAGCNLQGQQTVSAAQPRGATVAFDSIDGLPPGQFKKLVQSLNDEAQTRRLAVLSRETQSAYRVRGYLAAEVAKGKTTISWVWDVFDRAERRALRIAGAEVANVRHSDGWQAADDAMLRRIANASMEKLAAFLTSPEAAPGTPGAGEPAESAQTAQAGPAPSSPEAAGIFRIFRPRADPVAVADDGQPAVIPTVQGQDATEVPLPRRRPVPVAAPAQQSVTVAAARHRFP